MKRVLLILIGIVLVTFIARATWAVIQMNKTVKSVVTKSENIDSAQPNPNVVKTDVTKISFSQSQLAAFRADMIALYLKYQNVSQAVKSTEPMNTQFNAEISSIISRDLGVATQISITDLASGAILLNPEISRILSEIKTQYQKVPVVTPTSKISIDSLSVTAISFLDLSKYASKALTFNVTNVGLVKEICTEHYYYYINSSRNDLSDSNKVCNPYYSKVPGVYSDPVYFSNLASAMKGGYDGSGRNYFEIEGIDHIVNEFYLRDTSGNESNRLKLMITK